MANEENISPQPTPAQISPTPSKKTPVWVWLLSGCLIIIFLGLGIMAFLGWLGYKAAKKEIQKQAPAMQEFKGKLDDMNQEAEKWNQEADKWQKESQKMRESLPDPAEFEDAYPQPE